MSQETLTSPYLNNFFHSQHFFFYPDSTTSRRREVGIRWNAGKKEENTFPLALEQSSSSKRHSRMRWGAMPVLINVVQIGTFLFRSGSKTAPLALGEENFGFCCWRTWNLIWKNKILLQFNGIPCNKHVYFVEVLGEYPLITPSIISLISSSNSRCNWVILLFFRPDFYIQWPLVVSKKSCHKKVSLKYAPWSCIGKGRPISTAAAFENSFMSNSKLISWYFNTFKSCFKEIHF